MSDTNVQYEYELEVERFGKVMIFAFDMIQKVNHIYLLICVV